MERARRSALRRFLETEAAGGYCLFSAAAAALVAANSGLAPAYHALFALPLAGHSLLHWINDGLMAVFFLLIGLEVKREIIDGELSSPAKRIVPGIAALAGMLIPAAIYLGFNRNLPQNHAGWAIPAATDIAFALGVLALLGSRVPASLKILLTAIAIIDDLGAIVIIAVAYTASINLLALVAAATGIAVLALLNRRGVMSLSPYLLIGGLIWYFMLLSGVHATLAGVAVALTIPLRASPTLADEQRSPLHRLEHYLAPVVGFAILPLFGFANAGVPINLSPAAILNPIPLGVALGLLIGKQLGIFGSIWLLVKTGVAQMPKAASWLQLWGLSLLCGIGFTMSLFIAALAFGEGSAEHSIAKLGILLGSAVSALLGWAVLRRSARAN